MQPDYWPAPDLSGIDVQRYRCKVCRHETSNSELNPRLGIVCPRCFDRSKVPLLVPVVDPHATTKHHRRPLTP